LTLLNFGCPKVISFHNGYSLESTRNCQEIDLTIFRILRPDICKQRLEVKSWKAETWAENTNNFKTKWINQDTSAAGKSWKTVAFTLADQLSVAI